MLILSCFVLSFLDFKFVYVLKMCLIVLYINDLLCHCVFSTCVLFRRFAKQTRLVGSNKILIDSMLLNS